MCENSIDGSIVGFACAAPDARTFYTRCNVAWLPEMRLKYPKVAAAKKAALKESVPSMPAAATAVGADEEMLTPLEQIAQSFHLPDAELCLPEFCSRYTSRNSLTNNEVTNVNIIFLKDIFMTMFDNGFYRCFFSRVAAPETSPTASTAPSVITSTAPSANASSSSSPQPWGLTHMRVSPGAATEASLPKRLTSLVLASLRASGTFRMFVEADNAARRDFYVSLGFRPVVPVPAGSAVTPAIAADGAVPPAPPGDHQLSPSPTPPSSSGRSGVLHLTRSF